MITFTCTKDLCRIIHGKRIAVTKKTLRSHHIIEKKILTKYLCALLSIVIHKEGIENKTNQLIKDIINFNNKNIIKWYSETKSNIPEEPCYISFITPTLFINGQDESIFYVNSQFQVLFVNIFFRQLIINIDCEKL